MAHRNTELCYIVSPQNLRDQERETIDTNFKLLEQAELSKLESDTKWVKEYHDLAEQLDFFDQKRDGLLWEMKNGYIKNAVLTHIRLEYYRKQMWEISGEILTKAREKPKPRTGRLLQPFEIHEMKMIAWFKNYLKEDCYS